VFLAGTGRSGTTRLSNKINYNNEYRYIFEPFHPYKVNICRKFRYRQYLRPDNRAKYFIEPARAILCGKLRNSWPDSHNSRLICEKRLVKDIRANHLLRWIYAQFPGVRIILLLRHPCAVANSRVKLHWDSHIDEFLSQQDLMEDYLNPYRKQIQKVKGNFEKQVFLWCIENYVPLKQFKRSEIHLAFYENLCEAPVLEIDRLFKFLGEQYDHSVFGRLRNASLVTRKDSEKFTGDRLIGSWRKAIPEEEVVRAVEILSMFGLHRIYDGELMRNVDAA